MGNYKIGYSYNIATGEFESEEFVYLEKSTGNYPHAHNVTFIKPPKTEENQVAVFRNGNWIIMPDYRGKSIYNKSGDSIGEISYIGEIRKEDIIESPPEVNEHEHLIYENNTWVKNLDQGYLNDNGTIREMTEVEKINAGLEELPEGMKIVNGELTDKTLDDLYDEGKITKEEYNNSIDFERQLRYQSETDKLGLMYLRGECTKEEWTAAMDKIREELPKKE